MRPSSILLVSELANSGPCRLYYCFYRFLSHSRTVDPASPARPFARAHLSHLSRSCRVLTASLFSQAPTFLLLGQSLAQGAALTAFAVSSAEELGRSGDLGA